MKVTITKFGTGAVERSYDLGWLGDVWFWKNNRGQGGRLRVLSQISIDGTLSLARGDRLVAGWSLPAWLLTVLVTVLVAVRGEK